MKHKNIAYVYKSALINNYSQIEYIVSTGAKKIGEEKPRVICVVKADAYGHGIATTAGALGDAGCNFFAVSSEEEAAELREIEKRNGRHPDILILGHISPENVEDMLRDDIICAVVSYDNALELADAAKEFGGKLKIHLKLDTGMNRVGFPADERGADKTVAEITRLSKNENLSICGVFTHFSSADEEIMNGNIIEGYEDCGGYTRMQLERFKKILDELHKNGVDTGMRHAANSAASLGLPEAYFDAVRAGVIIYGLMPNGAIDTRFTPAMQFDSSVTHIHKVNPGERISYGATFEAKREMLIATVAAGYADGFERAYSGCSVKIGGKMYPQVGRICMDQFMVDITPEEGVESDVKVGDAVTLFGGDGGQMSSDLASRAGTINYEVICKVSKRVPREVIE
ncbi:MAG: alanine racemase [Clostridia bacterium]|nr:alanine racemase [Clostridia bacterium]